MVKEYSKQELERMGYLPEGDSMMWKYIRKDVIEVYSQHENGLYRRIGHSLAEPMELEKLSPLEEKLNGPEM